jgi:tetratricopeptide (TPR) repeat protein
MLAVADRYEEGTELAREGLALARTAGNRQWEWNFLGLAQPFYAKGRWDEALENGVQLPHEDWTQARLAFGAALGPVVAIHAHRGELGEARRSVELTAGLADTADVQERAYHGLARAVLLDAEGDPDAALREAERAFATHEALGVWLEHREAFAIAVDSALRLGRTGRAEELLAIADGVPAGLRSQSLNALVARFRARLAAASGDAEKADRLFRRAGGLLADMTMPFHLAVVRLEHGEWLLSAGREAEAGMLLAEACEAFERLEARPWIARAHVASPVDT